MLVRRGLIRVLYGDTALKMDVASFPVTEQEALEQQAIRKALLDVLHGDQTIGVRISKMAQIENA